MSFEYQGDYFEDNVSLMFHICFNKYRFSFDTFWINLSVYVDFVKDNHFKFDIFLLPPTNIWNLSRL